MGKSPLGEVCLEGCKENWVGVSLRSTRLVGNVVPRYALAIVTSKSSLQTFWYGEHERRVDGHAILLIFEVILGRRPDDFLHHDRIRHQCLPIQSYA